jgi:hypothetical protein
MLAVAEAEHVSIFFAGGQSNATEAWKAGIENELAGSGEFGAVEVAWMFHQGASMDRWVTGTTTDPQRQPFYETDFYTNTGNKKEMGRLQKYIRVVEERGDTWSFEGFFWFQGESNAEEGMYQDYNTQFRTLMSAIEDDLGLKEFPVCLALVWQEPGNHFSSSQIPYRDALRDSMTALANENPLWTAWDTKGVPRSDGTHIGSGDLLETVGPRMVQALLEVKNPPTVFSPRPSQAAAPHHLSLLPTAVFSGNGRRMPVGVPSGLSAGVYLSDFQSNPRLIFRPISR